jgi:hypothetical protein
VPHLWDDSGSRVGRTKAVSEKRAEAAVGHLRTAPSMSVSLQTASRGEVPDGEQDLVEEVGAGGGGNPGRLRRGSLPPEAGRRGEHNFGDGVKRAAQDREDVGWRRGGAHSSGQRPSCCPASIMSGFPADSSYPAAVTILR